MLRSVEHISVQIGGIGSQKTLLCQNGSEIYYRRLVLIQMEKKKLLEQLSKSFRTKEELLADGIFLKVKGDPSSARFFELYDRSIVYYATSERKEPSKRIVFDFDLIFEVLRGTTEEQCKKRTGAFNGLKFERGEESMVIFTDNSNLIKAWRNILAKKLNQRGFHELFKPIKKIGKGNFASVYLAIRVEDEKKFAIKAFSKEATYSEDKGKESLINEIELMRKFKHDNLMKLFEVYESENSIYVSVELLEGGQLYDKVKSKYKFTPDQISLILRGLLMGLEHMHAKRVMHRDLKPENILLRKEGDYDVVIADFGLATWADEPQYLFVRCGTPGYVAPEIVNIKDLKAKCDPICDVFSLGVISHILLTGKSPFPGKSYNQVLAQNRACNLNFESDECSKLPNITLDLLKKMLEKNPKTRITATQALKHPFFNHEPKQLLPKISMVKEEQQSENSEKNPINKTSIMVNKTSVAQSPLMTSSNPLKRNPGLLKDDSCLKFKMKETLMTGKTDTYEDSQNSIDSPQLKKNIAISQPKESRFGQEKRLMQKDSNRQE